MKTFRIARWAAVLVCLAQLAPASTLYFAAGNKIYKSNLFFTNLVQLYSSSGELFGLEAAAITTNKVFWGDGGSWINSMMRSTWRMNLDGTDPQEIISFFQAGGRFGWALDVDEKHGKIYFASGMGGSYVGSASYICQANLDGSNPQPLFGTAPPNPQSTYWWFGGIAVDTNHDRLFWTQQGSSPGVYQSNLDGTGRTIVTTNTRGPNGIDVDGGASKVYWTDEPPDPPGVVDTRLQRANYNGSALEELVRVVDVENPFDVALDLSEGKVYWSDSDGSEDIYPSIHRANLNGSSPELVIEMNSRIFGISVVPGKYCPYFHGIYDVVDDLASGGLGGLETADGDYVMAVGARVNGAADTDVVLLKSDKNGYTQWIKSYRGTSGDVAYSLCEANGTNLVLAGSTESWGAGGGDVFVMKTDAQGNWIWANTYGTADAAETGNHILPTLDDGFLISGLRRSSINNTESSDAYLVKIDANGQLLWACSYDLGPYDEALAAVEIPNANQKGSRFIVTGRTGPNSKATDVLLMGVNAVNGAPLWAKAYGDGRDGGLKTDIGYSLVWSGPQSLAVAGLASTSSFGMGQPDGLLMKTTLDGTLQWAKRFGWEGAEQFRSIVVAPDGGLVMGGFSKQSNLAIASTDRSIVAHPPVPLYSYHDWLVKTDASGSLQWSRFYGDGLGRAEAYGVDNAAHGGFYLAGKLRSDPSPGSVPYAVRVDSFGMVDWQAGLGWTTNDPTCQIGNQPKEGSFGNQYPQSVKWRSEGIQRSANPAQEDMALNDEVFCQGCTPCPLDTAWDSAGMEPQPGFYSFRDAVLMGNKIGDQLISDYYAVAGPVAAVVAANPRLALELAEISKEINGVIQAFQANPTETLRIQEATVAKARNLADAIMKELPADTANVLAPWVTWAADLQSLAAALGLDVKVVVVDQAASPAPVSVSVSTSKLLAGDKYTTPKSK